MSDEAMWFGAGARGLQPRQQLARRTDGMVHLAESLKMAAALTRGLKGSPSLYRVHPADQPQATDNPGDFVCQGATVVAEVESPNWRNDELWPLVSAAKWPDGSPMYNEDAFITDPPGFPASEHTLKVLAGIKSKRYLLPAQVMWEVHEACHGLWGHGW
jgi:hypothetical protein